MIAHTPLPETSYAKTCTSSQKTILSKIGNCYNLVKAMRPVKVPGGIEVMKFEKIFLWDEIIDIIFNGLALVDLYFIITAA